MEAKNSNISFQLQCCKLGTSSLQLKYETEDEFGYFTHPWYFHGMGSYLLFFDPWTGNFLEGTFKALCLDKELDTENWLKTRFEQKILHRDENVICTLLRSFLKGGDEEGMTSIIHIPNIRTYAILNKKEYGGFEPMDYCPFCGAKLPERLDGKLTEILQAEYGLNSWRDYKKAPHEFHTDEWWKKRGL